MSYLTTLREKKLLNSLEIIVTFNANHIFLLLIQQYVGYYQQHYSNAYDKNGTMSIIILSRDYQTLFLPGYYIRVQHPFI